MNKKLLLALYVRSGLGAYMPVDYKGHELAVEEHMEKFAELIVRECAGIADGLSKLYPRTDVGFDVGYTMGTTRATKEIKEHFGVEE